MSSENLNHRNEKCHSENQSTSYLLGKLISRMPWTIAAVTLVTGVGIATLLGLPHDWAWGMICWGLLAILLISGIYHERINMEKSQKDDSKSMWKGWWGVCTAIAIITCALTGQSITPSQKQARERQDAIHNSEKLLEVPARNAEQHWKATVADLHDLRFPEPLNDSEPAGDYYRRLYTQMKSAVEKSRRFQANNALSWPANEGLLQMSERHLLIDEKFIKVLEKAINLAENRGLPIDQAPVSERIEQGRNELESILSSEKTSREIAQEYSVPEEIVKELVEIEVLRANQLEEIELMQARMKAYYPSRSFPLPE